MFRILLFLSMFSVCLFSQCQEGVGIPTLPRIQGYVQSLDEKPVAGAKLELLRLNPDDTVAGTVRTETTNSKGRFRFKRSQDEVYKVRLTIGDRKFEDLKVRQGSTAMLPGGGLMNFVLIVDDSRCIGISLTK